MNKKEKLALFLGMLSGDGCLSIKHNGEGYKDYPIQFWNTEKDKVILFDNLLYELFGVYGSITSRQRQNRKIIWEFVKYSKKIVEKIKSLGFPEGVKRDNLRILSIIKNGSEKEKLAFIYGVIITDGSIGDRKILFHSGSKLFLEDLSILISNFIGNIKPIKEYTQKEIYKSYQLCLNKEEKNLLLGRRATMVLGRS
ncbi:hypothetical protein HYW75_02860 [Candidatus Pacearchaeota archaeon]|nr:hypothetical protein [Candidatus Pacearchaeota archaeon]